MRIKSLQITKASQIDIVKNKINIVTNDFRNMPKGIKKVI